MAGKDEGVSNILTDEFHGTSLTQFQFDATKYVSTHSYMETHKRVKGKQCKPRSDATQCHYVAFDQGLHHLPTDFPSNKSD